MLLFKNFVKGLLNGDMTWEEGHVPYRAGLEQVLKRKNLFSFREPLNTNPISPVPHPDLLPLLFIVLQTDNEAPNTKAKSPSAFSAEGLSTIWCPHGDLNPSRRRERAVSWARLDDRDLNSQVPSRKGSCNVRRFKNGVPRRDRTYDHLIKSQMLYQLS